MIIIAVDPGKSGGIAYFKNGRSYAGDMPQSTADLQDFLQSLKDEDQECFAFIEKVNPYVADTDHRGKHFNIAKLLEQASMIQTVFKIERIPFLEVPAMTWQSFLNLVIRGKKESTTDKKNRHKELAQKYFPHIKVKHATADALLILSFGKYKWDNEREWIRNRMPKPIAAKLI